MFPRILSASALIMGLAFAGCTSPCESLADQICSCKPNSTEQSACKQLVTSITGQHQVGKDENSYCSMLLDKCTCAAQELNDNLDCGLSKPGAPKPPAPLK